MTLEERLVKALNDMGMWNDDAQHYAPMILQWLCEEYDREVERALA